MSKYEYFPHDDRILVELIDEEVSQGGIIIQSQERAHMGRVLKVGPGERTDDGKDRKPMTIEPGQVVVFGKFAGQETRLDDEKLLVMKECDIIAVAVEKKVVCEECGVQSGHKVGCSLTPTEWTEGQEDRTVDEMLDDAGIESKVERESMKEAMGVVDE